MARPTKEQQRQKSRLRELKVSYETYAKVEGCDVEIIVHIPCPTLPERLKKIFKSKKRQGVKTQDICEQAGTNRQYLNQIYNGRLCCVNGDTLTALEAVLGVDFGYRQQISPPQILESIETSLSDLCVFEDDAF